MPRACESRSYVRIEVRFGVSYASDPHVVRRISVEAATGATRVLGDPAPSCYLRAFGDSTLEFVLRIWIRDPREGLGSVRNTVMLALWDAFKREGIEFPFPQRDMNVREPVRVVVERGA